MVKYLTFAVPEDYVFDGSGKVKSFSVGAYGLKDLGKDQYVHVETQVGRVSNDFTARNEIGEAMSGDTKSMRTASVFAMAKH